MIEIPKEAGYAYPLGPKMEKFPIPLGYFQLSEAVERLGLSMFPSEWTGEERAVFRAGAWGMVFRSEVEYEVARNLDLAVLRAECEKNCEDGGDPEQEFRRRAEPQRDDGSALDFMGDLPTLSKEEMKAVEAQFSDGIERAKSVRQRRERVEDRFLLEMLWSGVLQASRVALDGRITAIPPHTWAGPNGKRDFERGWVEESGDDFGTKVRPILINQVEFDAALGGPGTTSAGEVDALVEPDLSHTGLPGRPMKGKHLIEQEFRRRADAGEVCSTLSEEANALLEWLKGKHSSAPPPTVKTIKNNIRDLYRKNEEGSPQPPKIKSP